MPSYYLELMTFALGLILLILDAFVDQSKPSWTGKAALVGLLAVLASSFFITHSDAAVGEHVFKVFFLICAIFVVCIAMDHQSILVKFSSTEARSADTSAFYALCVIACGAMMTIVSARDFMWLFVSLELMTLCFYILVAYMRRNVGSLEAGVKYLILGALSTGFLIYGVAWIYGTAGSMSFDALAQYAAGSAVSPGLFFGLALVLIALAFKIGAAPMHCWIPDVYQGAPTPVTAYLSVGSKAVGVLILWKISAAVMGTVAGEKLSVALSGIAAVTLLVGSIGAVTQRNLKRLLAYSSITHAGFILLGMASVADNDAMTHVVGGYLVSYLLMTLGIFLVVSLLRVQRGSDQVGALDGLSQRNPWLAIAVTILAASLAGVPLTVGFFAKFLVFKSAIMAHLWGPMIAGVVAAAIGFYTYFTLIRAIWWHQAGEASVLELPLLSKVVLMLLVSSVVLFGVSPQLLIGLLHGF